MTLQTLLEEYYETRSYSGRGMHGNACLAIEVDNIASALLSIGHAIGIENANSDDGMALPTVRTDSMGQGHIIYFPYVPYEEKD